jgi:streptogramin lyase
VVPYGGRRECRLRLQLRLSWRRRPHRPCHDVRCDRTQRSHLGTAYGEGALWAITGWEQNTIERIDPKTNAVESIPLGRLGETSGWRYRMAIGEGTTWLLAPASLWRVDSTTGRFLGSVPLPHSEGGSIATGEGAVWIANSEGVVLRIDADSQAVAKTIPLGTLVYPAENGDALAVGEGSVWVAVTSFAS